MSKKENPIKVYRSLPWLIVCFSLVSSIANLTTGILMLVFSNKIADISLGVLTTVFGSWGMIGSFMALLLLMHQNKINTMKVKFIRNVSHELRTPLTSVRMYVDTLSMKRYDAGDEAMLLMSLSEEVRRLEQLTEKILDVDKSKRKVVKSYQDASDAVSRVLSPLQMRGFGGERIVVDYMEPLGEIYVDFELFEQALSNLIQNALKYGQGGSVEIVVKVEGKGILIEVRDHGAGISESDKGRIFESFERGSESSESGIPGFGLGLSIVKEFARIHRSKLRFYNHGEGGAVFGIWLAARLYEDVKQGEDD